MDFKTARLNRLFGPTGRCLDVAVDHGMFNERGFLDGIEDMAVVVQRLASAGPDAIQLGPGMAPLLQGLPGKAKPSLVFRTDIANVYGKVLPRTLYSRLVEDAVGQALRLDAVCVVVNLLLLPDQPELHGQCVDNVVRLKPVCEKYGMPLMVEPLVMQANDKAGGYMVDGDLEKILPLVRQAAELGADIIKADPSDDLSQYHKVVEVAGVPVLVRGGGKVGEKELFDRTKKVLDEGAAGIVYGRNIIQHPKPDNMVRALMAMLHQDAKPEEALKLMGA
jgi:DhnA family fructose-bisphosphate aldolase class Ia